MYDLRRLVEIKEMGLFDYFTNKAIAMSAPPPEETEDEKRRRLMAITRRVGTPQPIVMAPTEVGTEVQRPQLLPRISDYDRPAGSFQATPDQIGTYTPDTETLLQRQQQQTNWLQDTRNNPIVDNDKGFWRRLGSIGREFVINAGQAYGNAQGDPEQRLIAALGGGIAGGLGGAFKPTIDEERQRLYDIRRSQMREQELGGQLQDEQGRRLMDARIADIPIDNEIKMAQINQVRQSQARARLAKNRYWDPKNPLHVQDAIAAGLDPSQMVAFDDRDPKTLKLGNDILQLDRSTGKWTVAGTRKDLVDWQLPDGRTVSIPASNAAYNSTMQQMGAERIASNERIANARLALSAQQFDFTKSKYQEQMQIAEQLRKEGKIEDAQKIIQQLTNALTSLEESYDLNEGQKGVLRELIANQAGIVTNRLQ